MHSGNSVLNYVLHFQQKSRSMVNDPVKPQGSPITDPSFWHSFPYLPLKLRHMKPALFLLSLSTLIITLLSCNKDDGDTTQLNIHLTDNPYNATEVNVDIEQVRVKFSEDDDDEKGWTDLSTRAGIYNLLDFQNGIDTLIASATVPTRPLKEIRFVLGSDNSIMIDNVLYPLTIPSGSASGLKIKINKPLRAGIDSVLIDFDAAVSVVQEGNGDYKLKPVLRVK